MSTSIKAGLLKRIRLRKAREKAWAILTTEEQLSLTLQVSEGKSTWEAGEILQKAHYKYCELYSRASRLYRLFIEYFMEYSTLLPKEGVLDENQKLFFEEVIVKRKKVTQVEYKDSRYFVKTMRDNFIRQALKKLVYSDLDQEKALYELILEFDRWSSTRILPESDQQPSAYNRRLKSQQANFLKNLIKLPTFVMDLAIRKFSTRGLSKEPVAYAAIISPSHVERKYVVIRINKSKIPEISRLGIVVFEEREKASTFCRLVCNFVLRVKREISDGQTFWPSYRLLLSKSLNFEYLSNQRFTKKGLENTCIDFGLLKSRDDSEE